MDLKLELLSNSLAELISQSLLMNKINANALLDTKAIKILDEIKTVICDETLDDFYVVDEIVEIFIRNNIDIDGRHDF